MSNFWKAIIAVIVVLLLLGIGFFVGRATIETETTTKTEYITLPPKTDTCYYPKPVFVEMPADTANIVAEYIKLHPEQFAPDTVIVETYIPTQVDTAAILSDWAAKRLYAETLFDDEHGKCTADMTVQYNRLQKFSYNFVPVQQVVTNTEYKVPRFTPFVAAGMTLTGFISGDIGVFFKDGFGLGYNYMYDTGINTNSKGSHHGFKVYYRF